MKAIADGDSAQGIKGLDPIATGQLTREEIQKAEGDQDYRLKLPTRRSRCRSLKRKKGPRYTAVSRRQDRPNAILWLVRNHPELKDAQIMRLVGTTKATISSYSRAHALERLDADAARSRDFSACARRSISISKCSAPPRKKPAPTSYGGATLLPAAETTARKEAEEEEAAEAKAGDDLNVDAVFAKLKKIGGGKTNDQPDDE